MKTKVTVLGLTLLAVFFSGVLNIWIIAPIEAVILGNSCREGKVLGELLMLLIPSGMVIGGGHHLWRIRKQLVTIGKQNALLFLAVFTFLGTGATWFFSKLMDLWFCLSISGWI